MLETYIGKISLLTYLSFYIETDLKWFEDNSIRLETAREKQETFQYAGIGKDFL